MKITKFLTATAVGGLISAVPAYAQDVQEDEAIDDNVIIVTATKREQTLQEIPVAVSVTSAETIEQAEIRDLLDLQSVVPSLRVSQLQSSANTNFVIRGFGNGANNAGIEPSVGVFIDGVYRSRSAAQIGDLPNVERIEVLRGPQSTLFGKNASAGVISVVTQKPQFTFGGSASLTYGNFDTIVAKADVTGPISDTIAFSLAGNYNRRDGYAQDLALGTDVNDRDRWGARGQLFFEPSNDLSVRLIADYDRIDENCCIAANIVNGPTGAIVNALAGGVGIDAENPFSYDVYNNFLSSNEIENYGVSGQIDYSFGALSLTSITAYRRVDSQTNQDSDFTSADLVGRNFADVGIKTFTQELRLASDFDGPLNFLLGGYYFDENIDQNNEFFFGSQFRAYGDALVQAASGGGLNVALLEGTLGALDGDPTQYTDAFFRSGDGLIEAFDFSNEAYSIFGTLDFEVTDSFTLTAGFNYTNDKKRFSTNIVSSDVFSSIDLDAPQYTPFREQLLLGAGVDAATAAFLAANPTVTLPDGSSANPLSGLKGFQFLPPFLNVPNAVEDGRTDDDDLAWSIRGSLELAPNLNVYATYATGFKASSINLSRDSRPLAADLPAIAAAGLTTPNLVSGSRFAGPENAEVYEIGLKAQFDNAAVNIAAFKQSIEGFQSNVFTGTGFALANAGKQSTFGIEFDGTVTPVEPLTLFLAVTFLDPEYDSFVNSAFGDISGETPAGIPGISASMGASYTHEFDSGSKLIGRGDYLYESSVNLVDGLAGFPNGFAESLQREVNQLNASLTFQHTSGFELSVYGRNLTNAEYLTTIFPSVAQNGSISGYPSQPRTYGVTGRFKF
ncbi:TonB-dependent receptor [Parasphingorhabdus cellanae]|uniref:TonB-dependent receptor n=1 Tax=Parasphingorhabdus cellanae TaxID=2806553 RepID=A0ABX7T8M8_9SPHN|nr:TonB-dependent receptor [Parasphingorhabdus cellanae]QTD56580.1 TonB-dependent receptor [Parasphingorhabdus cellanae]